MYPARRYSVPADVALVYDFVNSLDTRHFLLNGVRRTEDDALASPRQLEEWLVDHDLLDGGVKVSTAFHREVVEVRQQLRALLKHAPSDRHTAVTEAAALEKALRRFPVVVGWNKDHQMTLQPCSSDARGALAVVVAGVYQAAVSGQLDRMKTCPAQECHWIFFDRTKPNTGRWCDSDICGNREKKRAYRQRRNG